MPKSKRAATCADAREGNTPETPKRYEGKRLYGQPVVTVNGHALEPRFDLRDHSPYGFEWGYGGSGPAQLALALLADCLNDDRRALTLYQEFKWKVVVSLPHHGWTLTESEIRQTLQTLETLQGSEKGASL